MKTISGEAQIERERERDRQTEGERDREERQTVKEGQTERRRDRQREGETDREKERQTERVGRGWVWFLDVYVTLKRAVDTRLSAEQDPRVSVSSWPPPHE